MVGYVGVNLFTMGKVANTEFDGALRRALQHKKEVVRQGAWAALARSGTLDTLREMRVVTCMFVNLNATDVAVPIMASGEVPIYSLIIVFLLSKPF